MKEANKQLERRKKCPFIMHCHGMKKKKLIGKFSLRREKQKKKNNNKQIKKKFLIN